MQLFLHEEVDGVIANYQQLLPVPADDAQSTLTATVNSGTSPVQLGVGGTPKAFITLTSFPGTTVIPSGIWTFDTWLGVDAATGVTTVTIRVYKRATGGAETELFNLTTAEIEDPGATLFEVETVQPEFSINSDDRLVAKYFANTTSGANRTVTLFYEGTVNYSQSIEEKQKQVQDALRAEAKVKQVEAEAKQKVAEAEGEAKSNIARARGDAAANRLRQRSLTPILVQWEAIQRLNPNVEIIVCPPRTVCIPNTTVVPVP